MPKHALSLSADDFSGDSMVERVDAYDWAATALGRRGAWPAPLQTTVELILSGGLPALVLWGPDLIQVFNDGYRKLLGDGCPDGLGQPARRCQPLAWCAIEPLIRQTRSGEAATAEDRLVPLRRHGRHEDAWFTLCCAPLRDEGGAVTGALVTLVDTTARHRLDMALRESDARARDLMNGIALATWETNSDGAVVSESPSWRAMTGHSNVDATDSGWLASIHPADRAQVLERWHEARLFQRPLDHQYRVHMADGAWRWISVRAVPVLDEHGVLHKWVGMNIDVHDRHQAVERLREVGERGAFFLALSDALRPLTDPAAIEETACRLLGERLGADRAYYVELSEDAGIARVGQDYRHAGLPSFTGDHPILFIQWCLPPLRNNHPLVVEDVHADARIPEQDRTALATVGLISFASTPLIKAGQLVGTFSVNAGRPRRWTETEVALVRETGERVWEAVERARTQARLRDSEERFRGFAEASTDALWIADARGKRMDYLSPAFERIFGMSREQAMTGGVVSCIHPEDRATFRSIRPRALAGEKVAAHYRIVHPGGLVVHARDTAFLIRDGNGVVVQVGGVVQDISDIEAARAALEAEKERFRTLAEGITPLMWRACAKGSWSWSGPQWLNFTGQTPDESLGEGWLGAVHPDDRDAVRAAWQAAVPHGSLDVEFRVRRKRDGRFLWHRTRSTPVRDALGGITEWLGTTTDIQALKELQERLLHTALHDDLTGLHSRAFLTDRLAAALERAGGCAVLFLDLDRFKLVNDSLGHQAGDQLLIEVARRLRDGTRPQDTVARFGGDEFALLIEDAHDPGATLALAERITESIRRPVRLGQQDVFTACSIGVVQVAAGPVPTPTPDEVLRDADIAMYHAKRRGNGGCAVFSEAMREGVAEALALRTDLGHALARDEFRLLYQPIHDLGTGTVVGVEALLRWHHPRRGAVSPATFIPVAEESGLIRDIGRWVIQEACAQLHRWDDALPGLKLYLNVNTSGVELNDRTYAASLSDALRAAHLDPRRLQIEVTESVFLHQPEVVGEMLCSLRALGVRVALDDFGTGYSSLGYLDSYRIDTIKIDRSFVSGMTSRPNAAAVVSAVVGLGRAMALDVVAEGVEDEAQLQAIQNAGCNLVQGFLLGHPVPADEITKQLASARRSSPSTA